MTITSLDSIASTESTVAPESGDRIPLSAFPKLVWVGSALFAANLVIGFGMIVTPNLEIDPFGAEVQSYDAAFGRISPFTQVIDTAKHRVIPAPKAKPVTFVPAEEEFSTYASLDLARTSVRSAELDLPRTSSRQLDLPRVSRVSQQLDMPLRTESAVYRPGESNGKSGGLKLYDTERAYEMPKSSVRPLSQQAPADVAPRRASEKAKSVL